MLGLPLDGLLTYRRHAVIWQVVKGAGTTAVCVQRMAEAYFRSQTFQN